MAEKFGEIKGNKVYLYEIKNEIISVKITNYGAAVVSVKIKDKQGFWRDIVLGYDSAEAYEENHYYFGAVIGRNCNRIRNGRCVIDGFGYQLEQNDGNHNLHTGSKGFDRCIWQVAEVTEKSVALSLLSRHMEQGFPGNMEVMVRYTMTERNELLIEYSGKSDHKTVMNLTNHTYFNLGGHESGTIQSHMFRIMASRYLPVDESFIPNGAWAEVAGGEMDFRKYRDVSGINLSGGNKMPLQLELAGGYDHNYVLDQDDRHTYAAEVYCQESGISMKVCTDLPGIQFYTGNSIKNHIGKGGILYHKSQGFCLETQFFPDSVNSSNEKNSSPLIEPNIEYRHFTSYLFHTCEIESV